MSIKILYNFYLFFAFFPQKKEFDMAQKQVEYSSGVSLIMRSIFIITLCIGRQISVSKKTKRFGEIAVDKGFASKEDVKKALKIQEDLKSEGEHVLIGIIMLTNEMLSNEQLIEILKSYES